MFSESAQIEVSTTQPSGDMTSTISKTPYLSLPTTSPTPIFLTPLYPTDTTALQAILSDLRVSQNLLSVPHPYTQADAEFWLNLQLSNTETSNLPLQAIRAHSPGPDGTLIGTTSLNRVASRASGPLSMNAGANNEYEVGYYLHPDWRGKGIITTAVRVAITWAKEEHDANAVIRVAEDNAASRKVVERMVEWERVETRGGEVEWPVQKGGGKKKLLFWKWNY